MNQVSTVGLDLAKYIFQLHGADSTGAVVFRKKLRRTQLLAFLATLPPCTVAMEACGSAHYWGREIAKLGHTVKLIAPAYVKPFVKRQKNDMADAEAICEAAQRPTMRFGAVKSEQAQAAAVVFRTRDLLVRQRTQAINALRGHLAEFGIIAAKGPLHVPKLIALMDDPTSDLPHAARVILGILVQELQALNERIAVLDREIARQAKESAVARRLMTIPGIGAVTAAALTALTPPAHTFHQRLLDPLGSVRRTPGYGADGDRRRGGASLIRALMGNCGNLSLRCHGRSPSGDHHEASVPMRSTGTDQPVRARKAGHAAGAKGLGQAVVVNVQLATGGDLGGNEAVGCLVGAV